VDPADQDNFKHICSIFLHIEKSKTKAKTVFSMWTRSDILLIQILMHHH